MWHLRIAWWWKTVLSAWRFYPFLLPLFPYFNWSIIERRGTFNIHSKTNYQVKTCTESCTYSAHPCLPCDKNHQLIFVILRLNSVLYAQLWGFWYQAASAAGMSCIISYTSSTSKQVLQLPNLTARTLFLAFWELMSRISQHHFCQWSFY